ncbi:MAG: glycosyltransferase family 4 protein [Spirulinaceae cyanobacterium SM2_1_0]|nr:glycosyltransferase family 4 protein [Spirulinaceae cyanobacterium SM2_1_0]
MPTPPYRVLIVATHPIPYIVPLFRLMAAQPQWKLQVAFCCLAGVESYRDPEFATQIQWDVPVLEGYPWVELPNRSPRPGLGRFWGLVNPQVLARVAEADVVLVYTGYVYATFWLALLAAKWHRKAFIFVTDASSSAPRDRATWKSRLKPLLLPPLFRQADGIIVSSDFGIEVVADLGVPRDRIFMTPSATDNDWWLAQAATLDHKIARQHWDLPLDAPIVLFCAKLQFWKRPQDILRAFAQAGVPDSILLYAGDGSLRAELAAEAIALGVGDRVRFLGFVNQTQLPAVYVAADLLALCSEYEPFGVVVNEAMLCARPVVVSDRVGGRQLVTAGENGFVYPCGDVAALAQVLQDGLGDRDRLAQMGLAARERMQTWSPRENVAEQLRAVETSLARREA